MRICPNIPGMLSACFGVAQGREGEGQSVPLIEGERAILSSPIAPPVPPVVPVNLFRSPT